MQEVARICRQLEKLILDFGWRLHASGLSSQIQSPGASFFRGFFAIFNRVDDDAVNAILMQQRLLHTVVRRSWKQPEVQVEQMRPFLNAFRPMADVCLSIEAGDRAGRLEVRWYHWRRWACPTDIFENDEMTFDISELADVEVIDALGWVLSGAFNSLPLGRQARRGIVGYWQGKWVKVGGGLCFLAPPHSTLEGTCALTKAAQAKTTPMVQILPNSLFPGLRGMRARDGSAWRQGPDNE
ncbi:hypothetical protein BKA70DRAFT_1402913 [Coprinopsis sp. MPI-PUGE-AT-0042]|nr:hypothetical protein BKA70DRAFT_1402913 [Coprinopsis sp. MPI-PUGE-AT-0042]